MNDVARGDLAIGDIDDDLQDVVAANVRRTRAKGGGGGSGDGKRKHVPKPKKGEITTDPLTGETTQIIDLDGGSLEDLKELMGDAEYKPAGKGGKPV